MRRASRACAKRLLKLSGGGVFDRDVVARRVVAGISLNPEFKVFDVLLQFADRVAVVVVRDIKLLALAGTITEIESLPRILLGQTKLADVSIDRSHAGIGHGEVGIEFDSAFVKRPAGEVAFAGALFIAHRISFHRLQGRSGGLLDGRAEAFDGSYGLTKRAADFFGGGSQGLQNLFFRSEERR